MQPDGIQCGVFLLKNISLIAQNLENIHKLDEIYTQEEGILFRKELWNVVKYLTKLNIEFYKAAKIDAQLNSLVNECKNRFF